MVGPISIRKIMHLQLTVMSKNSNTVGMKIRDALILLHWLQEVLTAPLHKSIYIVK